MRNQTRVPVAQPIAQRWSPRAFDPAFELSADDLTALGEAARWAPSAANLQPTRFVVARRGTPTFDTIVGTLAGFNREWAPNASALIVAVAEVTRDGKPMRWAEYDLGQAVAHLSIEATHRGLITHQMGGFDAEALREAFDLGDGLRPVAVVAVGRHDDSDDVAPAIRERDLAPRARRDLSDLTLLLDV
ncbi:MAG TPA: nitroreductase family protein [Arachnia sp.]|nr:nitroreductase family protein [Arachnia sp.]HMT87718.1 nitroreductase family protein [Arachnia sp.]